MNKYKKAMLFYPKNKGFNLQLFADDTATNDDSATADDKGDSDNKTDDSSKTDDAPKDKQDSQDSEKLYTRADLDKAVKDAEAEVAKLSKMNAEQKRQYELDKLKDENAAKQAEIDKLKKEALKAGLAREASRILGEEHSITATQDMLDFVVGDDADDTKSRIDKLVGIIKADRAEVERQRATGRTPKLFNNNGGDQRSEIQRRIDKYKVKN